MTAALLSATFFFTLCGMTTSPPNILWICTDSQRWDTLGCYGNPFVRTPTLDRLAREGMLFEHAYCQNPLCMPSRGTFLTGRYPVTNRLRQNGQSVPPDLKPVTKTLADNGFICGLSGKLHLSNCDRRLQLGPEWWRTPKSHWVVPCEQRVADGYSVFHWAHGGAIDTPCSAYVQWLRERGALDTKEHDSERQLGPLVSLGRPAQLSHAAFCVDKAVEFIELHAHTDMPQPWLFSVNIVEPHPNFHPPEEFLQPYLDHLDEIPLPAFTLGELDNKPAHQKAFYESDSQQATRTWSAREQRLMKAAYWAMCDMIDDQISRLLEALDKTGQRRRTLVIFQSDHGELLGDHGRTWKGPYLYEGAVHVPLIVSMPGVIPEGIRTPALVELTDLAPTLLDAVGLPRDPSMQGRSLWPLLTNAAPLDRFRDDIYCEYYNSNPNKPAQWLTMLRTDRFKLIATHTTLDGELYDLDQDPNEHRNLWDDPSFRDTKLALLQRLCARMAFTCDPMPQRIGVF